ncbi:MAG: HEAT repeat domain-containing protein [Gemmatimonadetes bacterium]|nr:HEAT repeat domain-containing protein [Gemmatimonadota bacterium]
MKILTISLVSALATGAALVPAHPADSIADPFVPAASWAPRDTADTLWRRARIAISDESWQEAADAFREIVTRYPRSAYAGDALYWEAFALQRLGRQSDLRRAVVALERQKEDYPKATTHVSGESSALLARVNGRLARAGDHDAAIAVTDMASSIAEATVLGVADALASVGAELARAEPEMRRGLAEARRGLAEARMDARGDRDADVPPGCEDAVDDERIEALNAMMQLNAEQAIPILKKVLQRRDKCSELLRRKAVFLVSQKRSDEAVDLLLEVAKTDPDRATREDAVFWLSQTGSDRATEVLEQILLRESDTELQKKAVFSLAQGRSDRSQAVLRNFIRRRDVDDEVRGDAIFWLGQARNPANAAALREAFSTLSDDEAKEKVLFSLSQSRTPENTSFLLERAKDRTLSIDLRKSALFWAGQGGAPAKDLGEIYDNAGDDTDLREQVIFTLSQRRDAPAVDKLIDIARKEPDRELRRQAIFWLSQSRDPRVAKLLEEIINK